jgi:hypothetical protein
MSVQKNLLTQQQEVHENCAMFSMTDWGWKIYRGDLFFPCKLHLSQPLTGGEIARSYAFVREHRTLMEGNPYTLNVTWLCNETLCHLDGYINKQHFTESVSKFVDSFVPRLHHIEHI